VQSSRSCATTCSATASATMIPTKRTGEYEVHFKTPRKNGGRSTARNRKRRPLRNGVLSFLIGKVSFLLLVLLDIYSMLAGPVKKRLKSGRIWMNRWKLRRLRTELTLRLVVEAACGRRPHRLWQRVLLLLSTITRSV
jgi:hypothetical protein